MDWLEAVLLFTGLAEQVASTEYAPYRPHQARLAADRAAGRDSMAAATTAALLRCALPRLAAVLEEPEVAAAAAAAAGGGGSGGGGAGGRAPRLNRACSALMMLGAALDSEDSPYACHISKLSPAELAAAARAAGRVLGALPRAPPPGMPPTLQALCHRIAARLLDLLTEPINQAAGVGGPAAAAALQGAAWAVVGAVPAMQAALAALLAVHPEETSLQVGPPVVSAGLCRACHPAHTAALSPAATADPAPPPNRRATSATATATRSR